MRLGPTLDADVERVDALLKQAASLQKALKAWQQASRDGKLVAREKAAKEAQSTVASLVDPANAAVALFSFALPEYFESGVWRQELHEAAQEAGLVVLEEGEHLMSSPVVVRALPSESALKIGAKQWSKLHPRKIVEELRRLRQGSQTRSAKETLKHLQAVWKHKRSPQVLKFREVYDLFCMTPGWKKDNPPIAFAQRLHALHTSGLKETPDGRRFTFEWPSGDPKAKDIMQFVADDGKIIRYYGIVFE